MWIYQDNFFGPYRSALGCNSLFIGSLIDYSKRCLTFSPPDDFWSQQIVLSIIIFLKCFLGCWITIYFFEGSGITFWWWTWRETMYPVDVSCPTTLGLALQKALVSTGMCGWSMSSQETSPVRSPSSPTAVETTAASSRSKNSVRNTDWESLWLEPAIRQNGIIMSLNSMSNWLENKQRSIQKLTLCR